VIQEIWIEKIKKMGLQTNMENRFDRIKYRSYKCITTDLQH